MAGVHPHFCCPHCGGVIFYTGTVDPTKDELENSKVSYPEKEEHTAHVILKMGSKTSIPHEHIAKTVAGLWHTLFKTQRKHHPNTAWMWWKYG